MQESRRRRPSNQSTASGYSSRGMWVLWKGEEELWAMTFWQSRSRCDGNPPRASLSTHSTLLSLWGWCLECLNRWIRTIKAGVPTWPFPYQVQKALPLMAIVFEIENAIAVAFTGLPKMDVPSASGQRVSDQTATPYVKRHICQPQDRFCELTNLPLGSELALLTPSALPSRILFVFRCEDRLCAIPSAHYASLWPEHGLRDLPRGRTGDHLRRL